MSWEEHIAYCIEPDDWVCYGCCRDCDYECEDRIEPHQPDIIIKKREVKRNG